MKVPHFVQSTGEVARQISSDGLEGGKLAATAIQFNAGIVDDYTPVQTAVILVESGVKKFNQRLDHLFIKSVLAGIQLSIAGLTVLVVTAPFYESPTLQPFYHLIAGLVYPIGLVMIQLTGSELFTSNLMIMTSTVLLRKIPIWGAFVSWIVSFLGNLAGSLFVAAILGRYAEVLTLSPTNTFAIAYAQSKIGYGIGWHAVFLKGIGANYLVCLAVWISTSARSYSGKILSIWIPVWAFVSIGFEHTVADMFFMPAAIMVGSPEISTAYYIGKGICPTVLGNFVGGGLFVACAYHWVFGVYHSDIVLAEERGEGVAVSGSTPGPMRSRSRARKAKKNSSRSPKRTPSDAGTLTNDGSPPSTTLKDAEKGGVRTHVHEVDASEMV